MCFVASVEATDRLRSAMRAAEKEGESFVFYKVVSQHRTSPQRIVTALGFPKGEVVQAKQKGRGRFRPVSKRTRQMSAGIYVYRTQHYLKEDFGTGYPMIMIKVTAKAKDLLGACRSQACLRQVTVLT